MNGVMSDEQVKELRERNLERAKEKIAQMGERWSCHPKHTVTRQKYQQMLAGYQGKEESFRA